jgi:hypothetical protein
MMERICVIFLDLYIYRYRYVPFGESPVPDFFWAGSFLLGRRCCVIV